MKVLSTKLKRKTRGTPLYTLNNDIVRGKGKWTERWDSMYGRSTTEKGGRKGATAQKSESRNTRNDRGPVHVLCFCYVTD